MNRIARAFVAATLGAVAVTGVAPAFAETKAPVAASETSAQASENTKYCIMASTTGSRIKRKVCATRAEWIEREGYDPLADLK